MTPQAKIAALKAGELEKVLKGTPFHNAQVVQVDPTDFRMGFCPNIPLQQAYGLAKANAAKVEVTKGVLDEVINTLDWVDDCPQEVAKSLTLLKTLREQL
jgi:hypothetical protein